MKKISFCIPVYNEEENIEVAYNKIKELFNNFSNYKYEIIFTDNHSNDQSKNIISNICSKDQSVKYLRFKNNLVMISLYLKVTSLVQGMRLLLLIVIFKIQ